MNIPYKFRGVDADGNFHYGDLIQDKICIIIAADGAYIVNPNSISQLIGYDIDKKEIYEGDKVIDKDGEIWDKLELFSDVENPCKVAKFQLRLKEV